MNNKCTSHLIGRIFHLLFIRNNTCQDCGAVIDDFLVIFSPLVIWLWWEFAGTGKLSVIIISCVAALTDTNGSGTDCVVWSKEVNDYWWSTFLQSRGRGQSRWWTDVLYSLNYTCWLLTSFRRTLRITNNTVFWIKTYGLLDFSYIAQMYPSRIWPGPGSKLLR